MRKSESYASVWDAVANSTEQVANLYTRSELMQKIAEIVLQNGWTETEAASHCAISQPRANDLLCGRVSCFSLDALVNIATALGHHVHVQLEIA
jgi:predicted XRE-type DNA-binding protein